MSFLILCFHNFVFKIIRKTQNFRRLSVTRNLFQRLEKCVARVDRCMNTRITFHARSMFGTRWLGVGREIL